MSTSSVNSAASLSGSYCSTKSSFSSLKQRGEKHFLKCPKCRSCYDHKKRTGNAPSKIPLIMNCGHTICDDCLSNNSHTGVYQCVICKRETRVPQSDTKRLCEVFQPHYTVIGYLMWNQIGSASLNMPIKLVPTGVTLKGTQFSGFDGNKTADTDSEEDDEDFSPTVTDFNYEHCVQHTDSYKNIKCETCQTQECAYCFLEEHGGHQAINLYKLTEEDNEKLKDVKPVVLKIFKQLQATKRKLRQMRGGADASQTKETITEFFCHLYARLQLLEKDLKKAVQSMKVISPTINNELTSSIKRVSQLLPRLDALDAKSVNVHAIIQEVENLKKIPCILHGVDQGKAELDHLVQFIPDEIFDNLETLFSLEAVSNDDLSLTPVDDWDDIDEIEEVEIPKLVKPKCLTQVQKIAGRGRGYGARAPVDDGSSAQRLLTSVLNFKTNPKNNEKPEICQVVVTHINDLYSFYVQNLMFQNSLKDLNNKMSKWHNQKLTQECINIGWTYNVNFKSKRNNDWRRGRLIDVLRHDNGEELYQIFYIDYGNTQIVKRAQMRILDSNLMKRYPFARHCKLHNPSEIPWDETLKTKFAEIMKNQGPLTLKFVQKNSDPNPSEVELFITNSQGDRVSISKLLLGESEQSSSSTTSSSIISNNNNSLKIYKGPKLFQNRQRFNVGESEDVVVDFIRDPDHLYVHLMKNMGLLKDMNMKMTAFYDRHGKPCLPVEGTNVVVKFEDPTHGKWHRARINSVSVSDETTEVDLVDWGNTVTVSWRNVRILVEQFTKLECQAILVRLADVAGLRQNESWPNKVTEFLTKELCSDSQFYCKMVVKEVDPLKVGLFKYSPDGDVCINSVLVAKSYAVSTGDISKTVVWQRQQDVEELDQENMTCRLIKKSEEVLKNEENPELEESLKTPITVIRCDSPDSIFFKFNLNRQKEEKLHHDLQVTYTDKRKNKSEWEVNEKCVIWCQETQYARGTIREKHPNHRYKVYMYDQARDIVVKEEFIYVYDRFFDTRNYHPSFVYKCYLANVKPAGDSGRWSNLSTEILHKIFDTYKSIYIVKTAGDPEQKLLGVLMWYTLVTPGSALVPSEIAYISVNKTLLECGAAIKMPKIEGPIGDEDSESDEPTEVRQESETIDWNKIISEEEAEEEEVVTKWPDPRPIGQSLFGGTLKCIDTDGNLWIRTEDDEEHYEMIEQGLKECFESGEHQPYGGVWAPGDMCTMFFQNLWYRGTVHTVTADGAIYVVMVDFESEHLAPADDLFKELMYVEIPPMLVAVQLDNVTADGGWKGADVDGLLAQVTNRIQVEIVSQIEGEIPKARITLLDGTILNDLAPNVCPNLKRISHGKKSKRKNKPKYLKRSSQSETSVEELASAKETDTDECKEQCEVADFVHLQALQLDGGKIPMRVSSVVKYNSVVLETVDTDRGDPSEQLAFLEQEIRENFDKLPDLQDVFTGEACVCLKSDWKSHGRATIIDVDNLELGYLSVFLVDYGVTDIIEVQMMKEIKAEWLELPVRFKLAFVNVKVAKESQTDFVSHYMRNLVGRQVDVEVLSNDPLKVQLYMEDELCYADFVRRGILSIAE